MKIDRIMDNVIYFSGVDMIDNTPVIDIKPYIPQYDSPLCLNSESPDEYSHLRNIRVSESETQENIRMMDGEELSDATESQPRYTSNR